MKNFILLTFSLLIISSLNTTLLAGPSYVDPPAGMPSCSGQDAPGNTACEATEICDVNGYCGTSSSSYSADYWPDLGGATYMGAADCMSIENNAFLTFTADQSSIAFDTYVYGCNDDEAIQILIFQADNCSGGPVTGFTCIDEMYAQNTPYSVTANGLTPGEDYYIMVDGYAGDVCDYTFSADSGVSFPVSVDIQDTTVCQGETFTVTAEGGDGTYTWDADPALSTTSGATVDITAPGTPGTYTYTVNSDATSTCENGTDATVTVTVEDCGCPLTTSNTGPVCPDTPFDLGANLATGNITSQSWSGPNGFTSSDLNPTGVTAPSSSGNYDYTLTAMVDGEECTSTTTILVNACPNGCDVPAIREDFIDAGLIEMDACATECSMYFLNPQSMTGPDAQAFAQNLGANLVSIQSDTENDCVLAGLSALGETGVIWIGLGDEDVEGEFEWYDQSPYGGYTNWAPGEPNNSGGNEDCVQIYPTGGEAGLWNDEDCDDGNSKSVVEVSLCPVVDAGPDITICDGETATMESNPTILGTSPYTYQWDNNGPNDYPNSVSPNTTTDYILDSQDQYGCKGADTMTVQVNPLPTADAGNDQTICTGESVTLTGSGGGAWDNGVIDGEAFTPTTTQTYTYTVSELGCTTTDVVTITVKPRPGVGVQTVDTLGCGTMTVDFANLHQNPDVVYSIDYGDGASDTDIGNNISHEYTSAGCFDVTITADQNGCMNDTTYNDMICILERPIANFTAKPQTLSILDPHTTFDNTSVNANEYTWDFGDGSGYSSEHSPSHTYPNEEEGSYTVTLVASSGLNCTDTARAIVQIEDRLIYYIPNTFTPDGDAYNQTFKPVFTAGYDVNNYRLLIFNRWGEVIFESNDSDYGWDGTYGNSDKMAEGTYIYKIEFKTTRSDERKMITGHVNLLR